MVFGKPKYDWQCDSHKTRNTMKHNHDKKLSALVENGLKTGASVSMG